MWFDRRDGRALYLDRRRETVTEILPRRNHEVVIDPDILADFTDLPFPANTFALVVMDPPHVQREQMLGNITKRYGCLNGDWREMLRKGFAECFRVLRPDGVLVFKWSEVQFPIKDILPLALPHTPLFGHQSGKRANTHWCAFIKPNADVDARRYGESNQTGG
jgi:SAM-dependent methyltransferase